MYSSEVCRVGASGAWILGDTSWVATKIVTAPRQTVPMDTELPTGLIGVAPADFHRLSVSERRRYLVHGERLVRHAIWEGARGVEVTDEMILTVAAHAALLVAGFDERTEPYVNVRSIVLHGGTIVTSDVRPGPATGVMTSGPQYLAGQSGHGRGPVLLDWRTVQRNVAAPALGVNVVYHEFAHKLDQLDGDADGMPPLPTREARDAWTQTLGTNYRRLRRRGPDGLVRAYAATNPAEYFAVTSELFFTRPVDLRSQLPRVYERLADFYRQDPARRR
jgi:Mlc titration factor MtfA (ptsG expression regulator)